MILGIDPGSTGAIGCLCGYPSPLKAMVWDMPLDCVGLRDLSKEIINKLQALPTLVVIESVHAMPGNGAVSMFKFGRNLGRIEQWAHHFGCPVFYVTPQKWQSILDSEKGPDPKLRSLYFARRTWPSVDLSKKKHHGRADALCIALYGSRWYQTITNKGVPSNEL